VLHMGNMTSALRLWDQRQVPLVSAVVAAGASGVTLFFVLSGFLLFLPYARAFVCQKIWPSAKIFYLRRIFRIFPLYYFSLFVILLLGHREYFNPSMWGNLWPFLTFTMSFWASQPIDGPYWTLAVEFQYYVLLPFIALAIAGAICWLPAKRRFWGVVGCLLLMIVWGVATRNWSYYYSAHPQATVLVPRSVLNIYMNIVYGQDGRYLDDFAVGMLIATLYVFVQNSPQKEQYQRILGRLVYGLMGLCLALFLLGTLRHYLTLTSYTWPILPHLVDMPSWLVELWFGLGYGCLVLAVLFAPPRGRLQRVFSWDPLRWLGLLTYSLYIWHVPFIMYIQHNLAPTLVHYLPSWLVFILCWIMVLGVALPVSFTT
ncbi:MAG: acyltransferase family protein, partial [Ktedonobacteraceae bacterium]